jgi:serine/threonine-protein kinase ULK/ATG1
VTTFQRESEQIANNIESFRSEALKCLRVVFATKSNEFIAQVKAELQPAPQQRVDQRLFAQVCIGYCEEMITERLEQTSEDQLKKLFLLLNDLLEAPYVNEFFEKNVGDINLKFNDQRYFDQMRRMNKDSLEELLKQRLNSLKFKVQK